MTVRLLAAWNGFPANALVTDAANEAGLVAAKLADTVLTGGATYTPPIDKTTYSGQTRVDAGFTLKASDDGTVFACTAALTVTIPAGLSPRPRVAFIPPASGNLSIAVSGGANINGAATTLTRARSANPAGVALTPYTEGDGYGVSGS
jgi:hypothetical protein